MTKIRCDFCSALNKHDALECRKCGAPLDNEPEVSYQEIKPHLEFSSVHNLTSSPGNVITYTRLDNIRLLKEDEL